MSTAATGSGSMTTGGSARPAHPMAPFDARSPQALVALVVVLVLGAAGFRVAANALQIYLSKAPVDLRAALETIPTRLGAWSVDGESRRFDAAMEEELGTSVYLDRSYTFEGEADHPTIHLHVAYYTGMIDAVPHVPDRCLVAGGMTLEGRPENLPLTIDRSAWTPVPDLVNRATGRTYEAVDRFDAVTRATVPVLMPIGDVALRTSTFSTAGDRDTVVRAGYFFIANGRIAVTPEEVRAMAFQPSEKYAYYCKVQVLAAGRDLDEATFVAAASDIISEVLPDVMNCLPDWAEVERRQSDPASSDS